MYIGSWICFAHLPLELALTLTRTRCGRLRRLRRTPQLLCLCLDAREAGEGQLAAGEARSEVMAQIVLS